MIYVTIRGQTTPLSALDLLFRLVIWNRNCKVKAIHSFQPKNNFRTLIYHMVQYLTNNMITGEQSKLKSSLLHLKEVKQIYE